MDLPSTTVPPISFLPPEVLQTIFTSAVGVLPVQYSPGKIPWTLPQICRTWRRVAISQPALWSSISIVFYGNIGPCWPRPGFLARILERSGMYPLSLRLDFSDGIDHETPLIDRVMQLVHCNMFRVKYLELSAYNMQWGAPLSFHDATALEVVVVKNVTTIFRSDSPIALPRLRQLTLKSETTYSLSFPLPFDKLTHLHLEHKALNQRDYRHMLSGLPNLRTLTMRQLTQYIHHPDICDHDTISLPSLKSLTLWGARSRSGLVCPFNCFEVPQLEELEIHGWAYGDPRSVFLQFFTRNLFPLRKLSVEGMDISPHDWIQCLHLVSDSLRSLHITFQPSFCDEIISAFNPPDGHSESPLCPHLESLDVRHCLTASDGALADMVQSRWTTLKERFRLSVLVYSHSRMDTDYNRLQQYHNQGWLELSWRHQYVMA